MLKKLLNKIIEMKIEKHYEKIREIFENHSDEYQERIKQEEQEALKPKTPTASKHSDHSKSKKSEKSDKESESGDEDKSDGKESKNDEDKQSESEHEHEHDHEEKSDTSEKKEENENDMVIPLTTQSKGVQKTNVKLSKIKKVMGDIAYLTGLGIITAAEALNNPHPKRNSMDSINDFTHFIWMKNHIRKLQGKFYNY